MGLFYSKLKMFHFPAKLTSLPADQPIQPPLHVRLKPTNRCNHNCRYCAYRQADLQLGQDMRQADSLPPHKALSLAADLVELGVRAVTFSGGGEPLIYPHLLAAARILADGGVRLGCLTNGSPLQGEIADFFAHRATWLRVSMDGWDNDSYRRYRGVGDGEYSKVMDNLSSFMRLGGPCVLGVSYIVDSENWPHIPEMLARLKALGVRSVKVAACIVSNEAAVNNAYHAPHFQPTRELIQKSMADLGDEFFEIQDAWHTLEDRFKMDYNWCPYSQIVTVIGADQAVYPCHDKAYNHQARLGTLENQTFKDFWLNSKEAFFRLDPAKHCAHHCVANDCNRLLLEYLALDPEHGLFV